MNWDLLRTYDALGRSALERDVRHGGTVYCFETDRVDLETPVVTIAQRFDLGKRSVCELTSTQLLQEPEISIHICCEENGFSIVYGRSSERSPTRLGRLCHRGLHHQK